MTRKTIEALLDDWEPIIRDAFLAAIDEIRDKAEIGRIVRLLERGDIEAALNAIHLDPAAFREFEESIRRSLIASGSNTAEGITRGANGQRLVIRFNARNLGAERWLSEHSSTLVSRIIADQREAVREALRAGMERGDNPRRVALDIVGRVNRKTGRREGGIVGLTKQQERFVQNARDELSDPAKMSNYLTRARRDKRFDRTIAKAMREGKPLDKATIDKIVGRYKDGLLKLRGDTIGRTEALASLHQGQMEAFRQAVASGQIRAQDVRRTWKTAGDLRVRHSHRRLNGDTVGLEQRFDNGLLYPGEPGAPVSETANCRCWLDIRIDFLANVR